MGRDRLTDEAGAMPAGFPREAWPAYAAWVRAGDRRTESVWPLVKTVFWLGARAEAQCQREGRAAAALEVVALVEEFGQFPQLVDEDEAHFAGLAAEIFYAGTPLRRRLLMVWRLLRPRWVGELAWRRGRPKERWRP